MIDLRVDQPYAPEFLCECGDPECLGAADAVKAVVANLVESLPQLESPLLKLAKERNAARELVRKLLYTAHLGDASQDKFDALAEAHAAVFAWKGGAK
jgi:hypothetical protein